MSGERPTCTVCHGSIDAGGLLPCEVDPRGAMVRFQQHVDECRGPLDKTEYGRFFVEMVQRFLDIWRASLTLDRAHECPLSRVAAPRLFGHGPACGADLLKERDELVDVLDQLTRRSTPKRFSLSDDCRDESQRCFDLLVKYGRMVRDGTKYQWQEPKP